MSKVKLGGNWSYEDQLDGKTFEMGERVRITWPDGSVTHEVVRCVFGTAPSSDMGRPIKIPTVEAFVMITHRGVSVPVALANAQLDIERVDDSPPDSLRRER